MGFEKQKATLCNFRFCLSSIRFYFPPDEVGEKFSRSDFNAKCRIAFSNVRLSLLFSLERRESKNRIADPSQRRDLHEHSQCLKLPVLNINVSATM